jgi:4-amino-4-deoxy-L-arabinose transferase-like glycosyltransferase
MRQPRNQIFAIVAILSLAFLATAGGFWWLCTRSNENAFLSTRPGAEWIFYPKPPEAMLQHAIPIKAVFRYSFVQSAPPARATLTVRAFKSASVTINGQFVFGLTLDSANWKSASVANVTKLLDVETNEIIVCVTNAIGPPALWLRLQTDQLSLGSDERWQVSLAGATWQNACRATHPPSIQPGNYIYGSEFTLDSLKRVWPMIVVFGLASVVLVLGAKYWLRRRNRQVTAPTHDPSAKLIYGLFIIVGIARVALFINNQPQLPRSMGFDTQGHERYIQFIQEKGTLPSAKDGWEMYQPPMYYAASAFLLNVVGVSVAENDASFLLRSVNCAVGLAQCWLALLCLRLLFPKNSAAQAAGLLIVAFLPPHLYLSQYVTNEPLSGLFVTAAFYLCLRALRAEKENLYLYLGIGIAMGLAMLTKFSSLLAIPFFPAALGLRLLSCKNYTLRGWLKNLGIIVLACVVVCGWHYGHVWAQFGKPIVGNWETAAPFAWWQDPGFRTSTYYCSFGQSLASPLFSGFHSFTDGFYSTLWGDGLISGSTRLAFRPPWNYDLMNSGYLLSVGISFLLIAGFVLALTSFIRRPTPEWLMVIGPVSLFSAGILFMSLHVPSYAQVKAFYGFPALIPFSALIAVGWNWLSQKHSVMRTVLWVFLLVWTITSYATFWIRSGNPETYRVRGIHQIAQQNYADALVSLSQVLQINPDDADTHCIVAEILSDQYKPAEAVQHYREALRIRPNFPEALNNLALMLDTREETDISGTTRAIHLAERACKLTLYRTPDYLNTLAKAYAQAGRFDEAISTEQKAYILASQSGSTDLLKKNQELLNLYQNHQTYRDQTDKPGSLTR